MSEFDNLIARRALLETVPSLTQDQQIQVSRFFSMLQQAKLSREQFTFPLVGSKSELVESYYLENHGNDKDGAVISTLLDALPPWKDSPVNDPTMVLAVAQRLGLYPRKFPDHFIYESKFDEYVAGVEKGHRFAIYNCVQVEQEDIPRHSYWHEVIAANTFATEAFAVFVTVNKDFSRYRTITPLSSTIQILRDRVSRVLGI